MKRMKKQHGIDVLLKTIINAIKTYYVLRNIYPGSNLIAICNQFEAAANSPATLAGSIS